MTGPQGHLVVLTIPPGPGPRKLGPKLLLYIWEEPKRPGGKDSGLKVQVPHRPSPAPGRPGRVRAWGLGPRRAEPDLLDGGVAGLVGQAAQDAALRHLEAGGHRGMRDSMEGGASRPPLMSLSSSSSWFRTGEGGREGKELGRGRPGRCLITRLCYRVTCTPRSGRQGAPPTQPSQPTH